MTSTSEDGTDIFEITDFTTASDFERFVARLEEVIHEWKLTSSPEFLYSNKGFDVNAAQWQEVSEDITYIDFPFVITHHYIKRSTNVNSTQHSEGSDLDSGDLDTEANRPSTVGEKWPTALRDLNCNQHDFVQKVHCLCRWFGLTNFVVITPNAYQLTDESRVKTVLSATIVAIQNSSCLVPIFMQSQELPRRFYLGHFQALGMETSFQMVHLNRVPERHRNLNGLLNIFKGKLNIPVEPLPKVVVSIRFTYILQDWEKYVFDWPQIPPDVEDSMESPAIGWTEIDKLPFGTCENPIENLHLFAMWCNMSEDVITDNDVYSDLEAKYAPTWTVRVTMAKDIRGLLWESIQKFAELCDSSETFEQVIGSRKTKEQDYEITNALEKLTEPQTQYNLPSMSKVTKVVSNTRLRLSSRAQQDAPIPLEVLHRILSHVFPDSKEEDVTVNELSDDLHKKEKEIFRFHKTAPLGSPIYNLAVCCCVVNYAFGGLKAVAHLWHEFVLEMRYRLENSILIPGLERGVPNLSQGLLYQKLQMLNCCIERKQSRERDQSRTGSPNSIAGEFVEAGSGHTGSVGGVADNANAEAISDEDEEFFDAEETKSTSDEEKDQKPSEARPVSINPSLYEESVEVQPQGRLSKLDNHRLLYFDDDLYIPITQEPAPMTEDLLAEHSEVLTKLGTSAEAANLRARMQSASLISDMESFKAANPGCVLEDFVRWYSPRDYITEAVIDSDTGETKEKGGLSPRMLVPGNMWQETWQNAPAVPARRQKRLFNDTREAEKVLHYLSSLTPAQVVLHLLPMVCQSAILQVKQQGDIMMLTISPLIDSITSRLENVTRHSSQSAGIYSDVIHNIKTAELVISRARSLHLKFACEGINKDDKDVEKFVLDLMSQEEVKVIGAARGPVGKTLTDMFAEAKSSQSEGDRFSAHSDSHSGEASRSSDTLESVFPTPAEKEYILRCVAPRPAPYSQSLPHRMHCSLSGYEYRLCGAFSSDSTFF